MVHLSGLPSIPTQGHGPSKASGDTSPKAKHRFLFSYHCRWGAESYESVASGKWLWGSASDEGVACSGGWRNLGRVGTRNDALRQRLATLTLLPAKKQQNVKQTKMRLREPAAVQPNAEDRDKQSL